MQKAYEEAGERYETLMTAPRSDLGDSIRKAFSNVDDILTDMSLEKTSENQRAVRILAYNSMEITPENIEKLEERAKLVIDARTDELDDLCKLLVETPTVVEREKKLVSQM